VVVSCGGEVRYTQFLIFELGSKCNLAEEHRGRCPSADADRYGALDTSRPLTDDQIVQTARKANRLGFTGEIGFHYYNEPTLQWDRMQELLRRIRLIVPNQAFVLWTNGTNLHRLRQPSSDPQIRFSHIVISNYFKKDWTWVAQYCDRLQIGDGLLDGRRMPIRQPTNVPCLRPFNEFIVDNFGNVHLCCADWRGTSILGNLHDDSFAKTVARFQKVRLALCRSTANHPGDPAHIPAICARCRIKQSGVGLFVPEITHRTFRALLTGAVDPSLIMVAEASRPDHSAAKNTMRD
jgi:hypothetical protein